MKKISNILNERIEKLTKVDYIILGIIILTYGILSFINLGSLNNPQTFYKFEKGEEVVLKFSDLTDVIRIKLYDGEESGNYSLYVSSDNKDYTFIKDIEGNGSFSWNEEKVLQRVKYVKLISNTNDSILGEISLYENSKNQINIKEILSNSDSKKINKLIDEQDLVPEEISYLNSTYFDEIYFARTAYDYANNIKAYEWVHPPLGKLIQAIPIKLSNTMAPFYYRLMGNIAGILMVGVMYIFSLSIFKKRKYAILGALLMYFDCFHFAHTRMGTIDSFLVLFIMLSFYYMYRYLKIKNTKTNLFLSGLFFALATSTKWTGLYAGLGLAILYFINLFVTKKDISKKIIYGFLFFVFIPLTIYISCYLLFPNNQVNYTDSIGDIINQQEAIYNYHSKLEEEHPFSSKWYTWPISYKPVWYYSSEVDEYNHGTLSGIGNIAIWWFGVIAFIYLLYSLIRRKNYESLFIVISILSLFLPYIFIGRVMFLYHYFPVLPFVMLGIVKLFYDLVEKTKKDYYIYVYLMVVIITFIIYYPAISGIVTNNNYLENLKLLSSWYF